MTHQFRLYHDIFVTDIQAQVRLYAHPSGATLVSVSNDDENKSFGVALRTMPANSNGVAHILEHAVLCGSKRYPVKSPFNELLKGSVNTFLNAMTYPDKTVYPVASTNLKDLYNLVSVYMDAVFHPLISEDTLRQEGWRYEFADNGALTYKGIVYNEMKGASATADRIAGRALMKELMPDTIYAHDSGGYPRDIPSLSYPEFVAFHQTYYHPSNALLFWYGDDAEEPRLAALE
ncbi:MAG: insulinase family protein, partial [Roseiflexaceae bacterium]